MTKKVKIAPSILSADFSRLGEEIKAVEEAGADIIHIDVMDGHFVPNITFGPPLVKSVRKAAPKATLDCHLMIAEPTKYVGAFCDAGADWVSVHCEVSDDVAAAIATVKARGRRAGIVLNPDSPLDRARAHFDHVDFVLIMSVFPGFGGQAFIPSVLDKIRALRAEGFSREIEVDGGVTRETAPLAVEAGADVLVAGSAVFGKPDRAQAIRDLRGRA